MGGSTGLDPSVSLDSTEIYSENVWRTAASKLPVALYYSRAIDISNRVLLFGKQKSIFYKDIVKTDIIRRMMETLHTTLFLNTTRAQRIGLK